MPGCDLVPHETSHPPRDRWEWYGVLVIYGVPILLGMITASALLFGNSVGITGTISRILLAIAAFNATLTTIAAVIGEVLRHGSVARRVWSAIFYGAVGLGIYAVSFMLVLLAHDAVVHFGYAFLEWRRPMEWRMRS